MTISEAERFEMHLELRKVLGDDVANTVMGHLPPSGWGDVARVSDLTHVHSRFDYIQTQFDGLNRRFDDVYRQFDDVDRQFADVNRRFDEVDRRFEDVDRRFEQVDRRFEEVDRRFEDVDRRFEEIGEQLRGIKGALWLMGGSMVTVATGIIVLLIQLNQSISNIPGP